MPALKPKVRDDLVFAELDPEAVVYDPRTAQMHYLNPEASVIYRLFDGTATMKQTAAEIAEVLERPVDEVEEQIRKVHKGFKAAQLLTGATARPADGRDESAVDDDGRPKIRAEVPRAS